MSYFQKNVFFSFKLFLISVLPFVMLSSWEFANKRSTFGSGCHCLGFLWLPSVCLGEDHNYGTCICMYIRVCFFKDFLLYIFWCDELFLRVLNQEWLIWLTARKDPDNGIRIWENMRESCIHFFPYTSFHICTFHIIWSMHVFSHVMSFAFCACLTAPTIFCDSSPTCQEEADRASRHPLEACRDDPPGAEPAISPTLTRLDIR